MKPLLLTLEGLQSYREKQAVDFSQMNGCGLFGIFGPTGSGKSTILDAMTLALFGRISRASFKTQGIINSASDQASVSLTFELSLGGERRTYLIERIYRRKKQMPDSCEARVCRLVRIESGSSGSRGQVLADKANDVDAAIEKLLGLNFDDFTRAVVLPQNQFQEFLLLGKKDKSDMLERLFCLEEYGRELGRKIATGRRRAEDDMRTAEGALDILYDCNDQAVQNLKIDVETSGSSLQAALTHQAACLHEFASAREVHQLSGQKQLLLQQQAILTAQAASIGLDRQRLARASQALPIWPVWCEEQELQIQTSQLEKELAILVIEAEDLDGQLADIRQRNVADQLQGGPRKIALDHQIRVLEQADILAGQMESLIARQAVFTRDFQALQSREKAAVLSAAALQQQYTQLEDRLQETRQIRQNLQIDPDWRQDLEKWLQVIREQIQIGKDRQTAETNQANWAALLQELAARSQSVALSMSTERAAVIIAVAGQLIDGEPCPVCGSREHPAPADQTGRTSGLLSEAQRDNLRRELVQVEERQAGELRLIEALRGQEAGLQQAAATLIARQPRLGCLQDPADELARLHQQAVDSAELERQLPELETASRQLQIQLDQETASRHSLAGQIAGQERLGQELDGQLAHNRQQLAELLPDFADASFSQAMIRQTLALRRQERQSAEQETERLQTRLRQLESLRQPLENRRIALDTRLGILRNRRDNLGGQLTVLLREAGFKDSTELTNASLETAAIAGLTGRLSQYDEASRDLVLQLRTCDDQLQGRWIDDSAWQVIEAQSQMAAQTLDQARIFDDRARQKLAEMQKNLLLRRQKEKDYALAAATRDRISQIDALIRGNAFVEYVAEERLRTIVAEATEYLETMTRYRFSLELDAERSFVIRDQLNGGEVRQAGSLSGGETFMASLALALALSSQIQIRGQSRLEFFFLDEGFGSLDSDLLDIVMDSLERISSPQRLIGLISHVPELRHRIGTRLVILPASSHSGSRIMLEHG